MPSRTVVSRASKSVTRPPLSSALIRGSEPPNAAAAGRFARLDLVAAHLATLAPILREAAVGLTDHKRSLRRLDPKTMRREDRPPDYAAFREAAINLLIHQDYADHGRKPVIRFFDDRTILWNPGDAFASAEEFMEPGEREVRNPRIVAAFRRVGLSEQAGTGIGAIFSKWRQLGRVPPVVENDKTRKAFQLALLKEELLSEEQNCQ